MFEIFGFSIYLLPFWRIEFVAKLSEGEVIRRIASVTTRESGKEAKSHIFNGKVKEKRFRLRRLIDYRNSFQAHVRGSVHSEMDGTVLTIWVFTHPSLFVFAAIPMLFVEEWSSVLSSWYLIIYLMTIVGFSYDANRVEQEILKLIDERI